MIFKNDKIQGILKNHIANLPRKGRGEVTRIAKELEVSTTLVSQVISGDRLLTAEQGLRLAHYLGLTSLETEYLHFVIQYERAGSLPLKKFWKDKIDEARRQALHIANHIQIDRQLTEEERSIFYSTPLYSAIRLYCSIGKGKMLEEIVERFDLERNKTSQMLSFLVSLGLCKLENNRYKMGAQKTHIEANSPHLLRHHANWRLRAIQRSENLTQDELMYSVAVSLSKNDFIELRQKMLTFIKEFLAQVHDSPAEEIACFNMDFFWIQK